MSEMPPGRARASLDDLIDAALRDVAAGQVPGGLRGRVVGRLERAGAREPARIWALRWIAVPAAVTAGLAVAVLLLLPGFYGASPSGPLVSHAPVTSQVPAAPVARGGAAGYPPALWPAPPIAGRVGVPGVERLVAGHAAGHAAGPGEDRTLLTAGLFGVLPLVPSLQSRGIEIAAAGPGEGESAEIEAIAVTPIAVAPIPPPAPVTIDAIQVAPIIVAPIDIPALEVKPLESSQPVPGDGAGRVAEPGSGTGAVSPEKVRQQ